MSKFADLGKINKALTTTPEDGGLSDELDTYLSSEEARISKTVHVSEIAKPCLRRIVWRILRPDIVDKPPPPKSLRKMNRGTAAHDWYQNRYYGPAQMIEGTWKCSICTRLETGKMPKEPCANRIALSDGVARKGVLTCADLGAVWKYQEDHVTYEMGAAKLSGYCDGKVYRGGSLVVLEMKTEPEDKWKERKKPEPDHVVQASTYAWRLEIPEILVSYIDATSWQTKDYRMKRLPDIEDYVTSQLTVIDDLVTRELPKNASRICSSKNTWRSKSCGVRNLCFS